MLSIEKIDEALRSAKAPYEAHALNVAPIQVPRISVEPSGVTSTQFGLPVFTSDTREILLSLRRRIVESGMPLKSVEELDREIDEMRSR